MTLSSPEPQHLDLAQLAFETTAAWDKYVHTDARPRPLELWTRAATLNEALLLASKQALGLLPPTPAEPVVDNKCAWCEHDVDADSGFCRYSIDGFHQRRQTQ
jgi:hypothetical protein